jgi:hypothetical protein
MPLVGDIDEVGIRLHRRTVCHPMEQPWLDEDALRFLLQPRQATAEQTLSLVW